MGATKLAKFFKRNFLKLDVVFFCCFFRVALSPNNFRTAGSRKKLLFSTWFDFSSSQIRTRDGWVGRHCAMPSPQTRRGLESICRGFEPLILNLANQCSISSWVIKVWILGGGGRPHSTEVANLLLTQQPWVWIFSALPRIILLLLLRFIDSTA